MKFSQISKTIATALFASALFVPLSACDREGPLEEAGDEIEDTMEDVGDAVEDAADDVEDETTDRA